MFSHRTLEDGVHIGLNNHGCTLEEFKELFPSYSLDPKYKHREYIPGEKHILKSSQGMESGPMPWPEGDAFLEQADDIAAVVDLKRHGQNWNAIMADPKAEAQFKFKIGQKIERAKAAAEKLKKS